MTPASRNATGCPPVGGRTLSRAAPTRSTEHSGGVPRGLSLLEVVIAIGLLAAGFFPIYSMVHGNRQEAIDAAAFLDLLGRLQDREAIKDQGARSAGGRGETTDVRVEDGDRVLLLRIVRADPLASYAPVLSTTAVRIGR